jgi:hypothetical protein
MSVERNFELLGWKTRFGDYRADTNRCVVDLGTPDGTLTELSRVDYERLERGKYGRACYVFFTRDVPYPVRINPGKVLKREAGTTVFEEYTLKEDENLKEIYENVSQRFKEVCFSLILGAV